MPRRDAERNIPSDLLGFRIAFYNFIPYLKGSAVFRIPQGKLTLLFLSS
jgi:hypothetical protein